MYPGTYTKSTRAQKEKLKKENVKILSRLGLERYRDQRKNRQCRDELGSENQKHFYHFKRNMDSDYYLCKWLTGSDRNVFKYDFTIVLRM